MHLNTLAGPLLLAALLTTAAAAPHTVNCRVVRFERNPAMPAELFAVGKDGKTLSKTIPSLSVEAVPTTLAVSNSGVITFRAEDNSGSPVVAEATIPAVAKNVYLFLMDDTNPDDDVLYKTVILEDVAANNGGAVVHNASALEARVTLGKETLPLPADKTIRLATPADKDDYNMAPLKVEVMQDDQWTAIKEGLTRFSPRDLYLIFAYSGTRPGETRIKVYQKSVTIPTTGLEGSNRKTRN